jgi:hypothetical protein
LEPGSVYWKIVRHYGLETGIQAEVNGLCVHSLRATAATNALSHQADIAKVQEWLSHGVYGRAVVSRLSGDKQFHRSVKIACSVPRPALFRLFENGWVYYRLPSSCRRRVSR